MMRLINYVCMSMAALAMLLSCDNYKPDSEEPPVDLEPKISVSPTAPDAIAAAAGAAVNVSLMANMDWKVSNVPDWLTVSPESGTASEYWQTIKIVAEENIADQRVATLTFSVDGASCNVKITQSQPVVEEVPSQTLFFESFKSSKGKFTIQDVNLPEELSCIWEYSADYECMKGTAFSNPANYESESWLISPEIDLTSETDAYLTFEHAGGYFGNASEEATLWVSKEGEDWKQLTIEAENYPESWTFITAGYWELDEYVGSRIKIAFRYSSTATKAGTWEIRNVSVLSGNYVKVDVPQVDPRTTQWMELPAMDDDAYGYYSHSFAKGRDIYRNYSFAWSQKDLVSVWVAYPLSKMYLEPVVERTDAWAYDPILGKELSSAPFSYYAGDYDRGHQLPSGDRLCCKEANEQTFYGTNIVPQMNAHNKTIWLNLENQIRSVAEASDTTYVVTGCVVDGSEEISEDSDHKSITVPVAFFKAILRYKKGSQDAVWAGAGFYTEHRSYESPALVPISMSIDELEEKTGLNFFVNLPAMIGEEEAQKIESATDSWWQ